MDVDVNLDVEVDVKVDIGAAMRSYNISAFFPRSLPVRNNFTSNDLIPRNNTVESIARFNQCH